MNSSYFLQYAKNYTSQGGEDGILEELFRLVGTTERPYCVEIGAWDGKHLSNSYRLVFEKEWNGLLVEANPDRCQSLAALYSARPDVTCLECLVDIDGDHSLKNILTSHNVPRDLDFISIDVDGADYHLWDSIGSTFKARVVCIEFNPSIANHIHYVQPRDIAVQEGSSLRALVELGRSLGYHIVVTTTFNAIFVRQDLLPLLPEGIFTYLPLAREGSELWTAPAPVLQATLDRTVDLNSLHNCAMATDMFQTYCGELKYCGPKKLLWHRLPLNPQQMQVIKTKKERVFPFKPPYQQSITALEDNLNIVTAGLATVVQTADPYGAPSALSGTLGEALGVIVQECEAVFGISSGAQTGSGTAGQGSLLRGIAEETLLNAVMMSLVAHRQAAATASAGKTKVPTTVKHVVGVFLEQAADLCELVGDSCWERASNAPAGSSVAREVLLREAERWWERAVSIRTHLQGGAAGAQEVHHRLHSKLSGCGLALCSSALPWDALVRGQGSGVASCGAAEDVDALLRGLFWLPQTECAGTLRVVDTERAQKLAKKWRSKIGWVEGCGTDLVTQVTPVLPEGGGEGNSSVAKESTSEAEGRREDYPTSVVHGAWFVAGCVVGSLCIARLGLLK